MTARRFLVLACVLLAACVGQPPASTAPPISRSAHPPSEATSSPPPRKVTDDVRWEGLGSLLGVARGLAFLGGDVSVRAYSVSCEVDCAPVFTTDLASYNDVLVHGDMVYVGTGKGVGVVSLKCRGVCTPTMWLRSHEIGQPNTHSYLSDPPNLYIPVAVQGEDVIVQLGWDGASGSGVFLSRLVAYPLTCKPGCTPGWSTPLESGRMPPTVSGDVLLAPRHGAFDAFDAFECSASSQRCTPDWTGDLYERGRGVTWTTTPIVVGNNVVVSTEGCVCGSEEGTPIVTAYQLACSMGGGTCDPRWRATLDGTRFHSDLMVNDGVVYVVTDAPGAQVRPQGLGFEADCTGACPPVARLELGRGALWRTPAVSGDLLFLPRASPGGLLVFDASCRGTCAPLRTVSLPKAVDEVIAVQNKLLVVSGSDLLLYAMPSNTGGWRPLWTWRGRGYIERVVVNGNVAVVGLHERTRVVQLPLPA